MAIEIASKKTLSDVSARLARGESQTTIRADLIRTGVSPALAERYLGLASAKHVDIRAHRDMALTMTATRHYAAERRAEMADAPREIARELLSNFRQWLKTVRG